MKDCKLIDLQISVLFALQMRLDAVDIDVVLVKKLTSVFYDSGVESIRKICDSYVAGLGRYVL